MIEARQPCTRRHGDAEFLPQAIATVLQLFDRRAKDMLDDHQPSIGGDDETLGRDQTVRDIPRVLVQHRDRGDQLSNEAQRSVDIELQPLFLRDPQDVGQPSALEMIRDDRQRRRWRHRAIDAPDASVVRVPEVGQAGGALAQRKFE